MGISKTCTKCLQSKSIAQFYKQKKGLHGRTGECKDCRRTRTKIWTSNNKERKREIGKKWHTENAKERSEYNRKWRENNPGYFVQYYKFNKEIRINCNKRYLEKNPERKEVINKFRYALKIGKILKSNQCQMCGEKEKRIHGHHFDYAKPLEVIWVCVDCHKDIHKKKKAFFPKPSL